MPLKHSAVKRQNKLSVATSSTAASACISRAQTTLFKLKYSAGKPQKSIFLSNNRAVTAFVRFKQKNHKI